MSTVPIVYSIDVTGSAEAQAEIASVTGKAGEGAKTWSGAFSQASDQISDAFKSVNRDVDNFVSKAIIGASRAADDLAGLAATIAAGGPAAVVGAIGLAASAWAFFNDKINETKRIADEAVDAAAAAALRINNLVSEDVDAFSKLSSMQMREEVKRQEKRIKLYEVEIQSRREQDKVYDSEFVDALARGGTLAFDIAERRKKNAAEIHELEVRLSGEKRRLDSMDAAFAQKAIEDGRANKKKEAEQDEKDREQIRQAGLSAELAARKAAADDIKRINDELTRQDEERTKNISRIGAEEVKLRTKYDGDWISQYIRMQMKAQQIDEETAKARAVARAEAFRDENIEAIKAEEKAVEKLRREEEQRNKTLAEQAKRLKEKREEEFKNTVATQASAAAQLAYGVATTVVNPVVQEFTATLRQLGEVNRDNYRDFLNEAQDLPGIIARKAQAIMGGIAAEATGKAIFEEGEALRETALGLGLVAIPGMQAQAAGHFMSAATHYAAASVYGVLGAGAAAGAVGVGAMRGSDTALGLGLTNEEKRQKKEEEDRKRERDRSNGSRDSGRMGGGLGSGGSGTDQTVINVTMEFGAGSLAPEDSRRFGRTFAQGYRAMQRSGWNRIQAGG